MRSGFVFLLPEDQGLHPLPSDQNFQDFPETHTVIVTIMTKTIHLNHVHVKESAGLWNLQFDNNEYFQVPGNIPEVRGVQCNPSVQEVLSEPSTDNNNDAGTWLIIR